MSVSIEFVFEFGGVYSVSQVVSGPVCDVGNQFFAGPFRPAQESVDGFDDDLYQVNVLPFVEASDVVCTGSFTFVENEVYGPCVVLDIQPVAYVFTFTVYGQWLVVPDVVE